MQQLHKKCVKCLTLHDSVNLANRSSCINCGNPLRHVVDLQPIAIKVRGGLTIVDTDGSEITIESGDYPIINSGSYWFFVQIKPERVNDDSGK